MYIEEIKYGFSNFDTHGARYTKNDKDYN